MQKALYSKSKTSSSQSRQKDSGMELKNVQQAVKNTKRKECVTEVFEGSSVFCLTKQRENLKAISTLYLR